MLIGSMTYPFDDTLKQRIRTHIHQFDDRRAPEDGLKHAAVSVVVIGHGDEAAFILTKRSPRLKSLSPAAQPAPPPSRTRPPSPRKTAARPI